MNTHNLKRGAECYWKTGGSFSLCYFLEKHDFQDAVTIRHRGREVIVRQSELFTEDGVFREKHGRIIASLKESWKSLAEVSRLCAVPYSRVRMVYHESINRRIINAKESR